MANEVLVIGDSFFGQNHQITAYLEELARNAGALSVGERYRDNSGIIGNALALGGNGLLDQYSRAVEEGPVKLVIMNGGGADVLVGDCATASPECPLLSNAADAARELLARMAMDGVLHVVVAFYPDPLDADVRERMDALRPLMQGVCGESAVPCHFVDLRATFAGHYDDYILSDGLNPSPAGAEATANAVWATLRQFCIAQ